MSNLKNIIKKTIKKKIPVFIVGFVFAILCFAAVNAAMEPLSKPQYCGSRCHEMKTAYDSWQSSRHYANENGIRIECIDCHLPPKDDYFTHLTVKACLGSKDLYKHYFGGKYDSKKMSEKVLAEMPNQRCINCHDNLLAKPSSKVVEIVHKASLDKPDAPQGRCLSCHKNTGHEHENKKTSQ